MTGSLTFQCRVPGMLVRGLWKPGIGMLSCVGRARVQDPSPQEGNFSPPRLSPRTCPPAMKCSPALPYSVSPWHLTRRSLTADHLALRQAIDRAVLASSSLDDFCDRLAADSPYYVLFVPYTIKGGHEREGISYGLQADRAKRATPGYALGRDYVFGNIVQRINGRTNSLTLGQNPVPAMDKKSEQNGVNKVAKVVGDLAPSLPFAGTAARHESDIERDIARITRSLHETASKPPENAGGKPTKGVLPKPLVRKPKRRKGL